MGTLVLNADRLFTRFKPNGDIVAVAWDLPPEKDDEAEIIVWMIKDGKLSLHGSFGKAEERAKDFARRL